MSCNVRDGGKFLRKGRKPQHGLCIFPIPGHRQTTVGLGFCQKWLQQQPIGFFPQGYPNILGLQPLPKRCTYIVGLAPWVAPTPRSPHCSWCMPASSLTVSCANPLVPLRQSLNTFLGDSFYTLGILENKIQQNLIIISQGHGQAMDSVLCGVDMANPP